MASGRGSMTANQREAIRNSLLKVIASTHLSQRRVARLVGVSYETINRILRCDDMMVSDRMWNKVKNALDDIIEAILIKP